MKKFISLLISVVMLMAVCFTFAACSSSSDETKAEGEGSADSDFTVGAIYINSQNDTAGYTYAHHKGITTAMEDLGLDTSTQLKIVDNIPEDYDQVMSAIDQLAGQGCDIIFGISFGYLDAFNDAAEEYPDIVFSHATGYLSNDSNFNNYFGRIYQARYLAGIAAGMKSLEVGNNNIGYVSAWGTEYAETCSGINAFALGAQAANPDAIVHVKQISTWGDEALERQAAEVLIDTYGCGVIAQHCDSAQPQIVAAEKGVFGCGYNSDMSEQAPSAHLTAPVWNWNVYYQYAMEVAMAHDASEFVSIVGNYYGGLAEGMVDVSALTANCTPGTAEAIEIARDLMVSGQWDVFSGVKLSVPTDTDTITFLDQRDEDLVTNDGTVIVSAGGPSVDDGVIQGSMNYYVAGVVAES